MQTSAKNWDYLKKNPFENNKNFNPVNSKEYNFGISLESK